MFCASQYRNPVSPPGDICDYISCYFGSRIYRKGRLRKEFESDIALWHQDVLLWVEDVNQQVTEWNDRVAQVFTERNEIEWLQISPSFTFTISPELIANIFESPTLSAPNRQRFFRTIIDNLFELYYSAKDHFTRLHNICVHLLNKNMSQQPPVVKNIEPYAERFQHILSLQHIVEKFDDPVKALEFLHNIPVENIAESMIHEVNRLVWEQVRKIDAEDE
jgi:hypothetical protein